LGGLKTVEVDAGAVEGAAAGTGISQDNPDLLTEGGNPDGAGADPGKAGQGTDTGTDQGEGEKTFPTWMGQLTGDLQKSESLTKFKNISELGKAYGELEGRLGKSITIPGEDSTDEERANFFAKLGRPENADGYELQFGENIPEYMKKAFQADEKEFRELMFKSGFSGDQAKAMHGYIQDKLLDGQKLEAMFRQKQYNDGTTALKESWGADFGKNLNISQMALQRFADIESIQFLKESGLGNHPGVIKMMYKIGQAISEDTFVDGGEAGGKFDPDNHVLFT